MWITCVRLCCLSVFKTKVLTSLINRNNKQDFDDFYRIRRPMPRNTYKVCHILYLCHNFKSVWYLSSTTDILKATYIYCIWLNESCQHASLPVVAVLPFPVSLGYLRARLCRWKGWNIIKHTVAIAEKSSPSVVASFYKQRQKTEHHNILIFILYFSTYRQTVSNDNAFFRLSVLLYGDVHNPLVQNGSSILRTCVCLFITFGMHGWLADWPTACNWHCWLCLLYYISLTLFAVLFRWTSHSILSLPLL